MVFSRFVQRIVRHYVHTNAFSPLVSYLFAFIAFFLTLNIFDHFFLFVRVAYFNFYGQKLYAHAKTLPGTLLQ